MIKNNFQIKYLNLQRRELEPGHKEVIHSAPCYLCYVCSKTWFPKSPSTKFSSQRKSKEKEQEPTSLRTYRISMNRVPKGFSWISIPDSYQSKTGSGFPRKPRNLMKNTPIQELQIPPKLSRIPIDGQCLINLNPWFPHQIRDLIGRTTPRELWITRKLEKDLDRQQENEMALFGDYRLTVWSFRLWEKQHKWWDLSKGGWNLIIRSRPISLISLFRSEFQDPINRENQRQFLGCSEGI